MKRNGTLPPKLQRLATCSVDDCDGAVVGLGLCGRHYQRLKKRGSIKLAERPTGADRFWAKVDRRGDDECWPWLAACDSKGYGSFWTGKDAGRAYRFAYELLIGPIPAGLVLDHLCRNPNCVNPYHLEAVTHRENNLRSESAGSLNARKTHCPQGHPYDENNTTIRDGRRFCRTCHNTRERERNARKREG